MFDEVVVPLEILQKWRLKIPDFFAGESEIVFQTKDFECLLDIYYVEDILTFEGDLKQFTGEVEIYTSNICGGGPRNGKYALYTENGVQAESVNYTITLINGKVDKIVDSGYDKQDARDKEVMFADFEEEGLRKEQLVRERAYQISLQRNGGPGDELSDWLTAEKQIRDEEWESWRKA